VQVRSFLLSLGMATTHGVGVFAFEGCLMIYFIQCGKNGPIKIGQTDNDVQSRLNQLQTGCPYELKLLWVYTGHDYSEAQIHAVLSKERIRGEWFHPSGHVLNFIDTEMTNYIVVETPNGRIFEIKEGYDFADEINIKTGLTGSTAESHKYTTIYHDYGDGSIEIDPADKNIEICVHGRDQR
jgi:hypothetical protein